MAYVNVKDWSVEQVTDWLKGLDNVILPYIKSFLNNGVNGHQLLNLRADDLEHLGVGILGHQEIILESVEHIRNFHYELDKENLQMLALRLSCAATSLSRELQFADENARMATQTLSDVHNIISTIKPLVCWLDRSPFRGDKDYTEMKTDLLNWGFETATFAHRDTFCENPVVSIRDNCEKLKKLADRIIQEILDPMILQPATLDLSTLRKKEQELGFYISANNSAIHQIAEIKYGTPAHMSTKIEEGDEIVQVNYQTVVGWQRKKVMMLLEESPPEIVLTLKKRPRHTKVYGQIYMKPYRLPSKKRAAPYSRWNENLPSPRLLTIHDLPQLKAKEPEKKEENSEIESVSDTDSEPPDSPLDTGLRLYPLKPRSVLQRRNTITGTIQDFTRVTPALEEYWKTLKKNRAVSTHSSSYNLPTDKFEDESMYIRDKSASCSHGLELTQRPATVIALSQNRKNSFKADFSEKIKKNVNFDDTKTIINDIPDARIDDKRSISTNSLSSLKDENIDFIDVADDLQDRSNMTITSPEVVEEKVESVSVRCLKECIVEAHKPKVPKPSVKDTVLEDVHVDNIIKKFDQQIIESKPRVLPRTSINKVPVIPQKPAVLPRSITAKNRGKLDKSHSTPAYDLTNDETEDKKESLLEKSENNNEEISKIPVLESSLNSPKLVNEVCPPPQYLQIKYELGIPILHDVTYNPPVIEPRKKAENKNKLEVPPKPPPRTNIPELLKRKVIEAPISITSNTPDIIDNKIEKKTDFDTDKASNCGITFEPSVVSTPVANKQLRDDILKVDTHAKSPSSEVVKTYKTSPTNLVARAIYSSKSKSGKKKNSLLAKKRKVSVSDVSPGEIQGYLHQRLRSKHNQNVHWEKRWFVLHDHCLYGFKSKDSGKAECYIYLSGFTVAVATEVKSRQNAFKVYHTGTVFYFSADSEETLSSWIELIKLATFISSDAKLNDQIVYSETDDDTDTEIGTNKSSTLEKPADGVRKFNSLKKFTSKKRSDSSANGSTSLDRKWFFNKSNNQKNALPVPTAQFRSYRKINGSTTIGNFTSHIPNFANKMEIPPLQPSAQNSNSNLSIDSIPNTIQEYETYPKAKLKTQHLHASNPSLCNFVYNSFQFPKPRPKASDNLIGCVTLEELMNREGGERKFDDDLPPINTNLIRPDVVYGEIPIRPNRETTEFRSSIKKTHTRTSSDCSETKKESSCFGKRSSSIKSNNPSFGTPKHRPEIKLNSSLPRTPKYCDNNSIGVRQKSNSSKSLTKNKGSYEMIYCPQTMTDIHFAQNRTLDGRMYHQDVGKKNGLKSAMQYTPVPLTPDEKPKFNLNFELNLDEKTHKGGKFKQFFMKQDSKKDKKNSPKVVKTSLPEANITWPTPQRAIGNNVYSPESYSTSMTDMMDAPIGNSPPSTDYPGLEYPPVFQAETYSLANPQGTLLKKHQKNN